MRISSPSKTLGLSNLQDILKKILFKNSVEKTQIKMVTYFQFYARLIVPTFFFSLVPLERIFNYKWSLV